MYHNETFWISLVHATRFDDELSYHAAARSASARHVLVFHSQSLVPEPTADRLNSYEYTVR